MSRSVALAAPAKVNLVLRALHRRDDGYRELETVFQMISLADRVSVSLQDEPGGIHLDVDGPDLGPVASNLAYRAAASFAEATGVDREVRVHLTKRIPAGAGLGGGSSDAAAVLRCMARLTESKDRPLLHRLAADLGSDVPFFLGPEPIALGRGRGEILTPITPLPAGHLVVAMPEVHVSTVEAYQALTEARAGAGGDWGETGVDDPGSAASGPRSNELFQDLGWVDVRRLSENDFEAVVVPRHAAIGASIDGLRAQGAALVLLSGSGSASFGVFEEGEAAERAAALLTADLGWPFVHVRTLTTLPGFEDASTRG